MFESLARIASALERLLATGQLIIEQQRLIDAKMQELQQSVQTAQESCTTVTQSHLQFQKWMIDHLAYCETWHAKTLQAVVTTGSRRQ